MTRRILFAAPLFLVAWLASVPTDVRGCAPAPRAGETVDVANETALIIWDEAAGTEHFIRQATFVGTAHDFGFLVPTPNRPVVESADPDLFRELARLTEAKTEHRTETSLSFGCAASPSASGDNPSDTALPRGVTVLEQKRVGNLDAAVLAFRADKTQKVEDTADELLGWLNSRGYAVRPDLAAWLKPYIENNWIVTAFKIAGQPGAETPPKGGSVAVKAAAVRMSFKTERPFFPYREPAAQRDEQSGNTPRLLRVFVAAKQRMAGRLGDSTAWPGQTVWADAIVDSERVELLGKAGLPAETLALKWWITEFEDGSTPRPGTDEVYFERSMDRGAVARAPIVVVTTRTPWWAGPLAVILLLVLGGAGLMLIRRFIGGAEEETKPETQPPKPENTSSKTSDRGPGSDPRRWS